jgi:hypothetical protein
MSQGGPLIQFNQRQTPLEDQLPKINGFPTNIGTLVCASTAVPISNEDTAVPFELTAGQYVHLQANAPCFIGAGFSSALAKANALAVSKRLDAWEPWETFLPDLSDNPTNATPIATTNRAIAQWRVWLAVVLQSAGTVTLYVGRVK